MIGRHATLIVAAMIIVGCSYTTAPVDQGSTSAPTVNPSADPKPETHIHQAERIALDFIDAIRRGEHADNVPEILADAELASQERVVAFRMLERFIKSQDWNLWFTCIDVFDGKEDSVNCYLRGADGELLVLLLGYHYDVDEWRVGAGCHVYAVRGVFN